MSLKSDVNVLEGNYFIFIKLVKHLDDRMNMSQTHKWTISHFFIKS